MFIMTAKVDKKKILLVCGAVLALVAIIIAVCSGGGSAATSASGSVTSNDDRVQFLAAFGWEVAASPVESGQVRIPENTSEVFDRYNALQKTMGYDLTDFAGKTVMRYVYKVKNYPGATADVYATLLISNNQIIGGDITDTSANGKIQGFAQKSEAAGK